MLSKKMTHLIHFICGQKKKADKIRSCIWKYVCNFIFWNFYLVFGVLSFGSCASTFVWPRCLKLGEGKSAQMFCTLLLLLNSLLVLGQWKKNAYDLSLAVVIQLCKRSAKSPSFLRIPVGHFSCTTFLQLKVLSLWDNLYETLRTKSETQVV